MSPRRRWTSTAIRENGERQRTDHDDGGAGHAAPTAKSGSTSGGGTAAPTDNIPSYDPRPCVERLTT